ncbi:hypothetical protein C0081_17355 [Cohaesibacter celericrescens]|uniref:Uncharacterized protein n=1 Tax=Cohaesibacter celericrescens TaxID=2067669 RepID=A0A2N5XN63_9HYPH|nr:hypothetical protein C0081_17355 [Cohaesibacter celericrescens]
MSCEMVWGEIPLNQSKSCIYIGLLWKKIAQAVCSFPNRGELFTLFARIVAGKSKDFPQFSGQLTQI